MQTVNSHYLPVAIRLTPKAGDGINRWDYSNTAAILLLREPSRCKFILSAPNVRKIGDYVQWEGNGN